MKKKIFMACTALVVSAAAVVGVKAYNYYSMPPLMRANLEALSQDNENPRFPVVLICNPVNDATSVCVAACPICHYPHIDSKKGQELSSASGNCEKCGRNFSIKVNDSQ